MNIIKFRQKRGFRLFNKPSNATKRDEYGLSQRQRCFEEFDKGKDWMLVAKEFHIKPTTCRRYYQTWKKLPKEFESVYRHMVLALKDPNVRSSAVNAFSHQLGLAPDEVEQILLRPWGLRSLLLARFGLKKIEVRHPEDKKSRRYRRKPGGTVKR